MQLLLLKTLVNMGILERIQLFGKRKRIFGYRHLSPVVDFAHYLNAKYGFFETELPDEAVKRYLGREYRTTLRSSLKDCWQSQPVRIEMPDLEIGIALVKK
ncbi:hypothetical protein [Pyrococcus kukulkanii]|uniref:hypothetical protein n=1 Tax=Pyrococcus kukulkanii TaxID=1609559 RepID=UPI00356AB17E